MTSELRRAFDPVADALAALGIDYRIGGSVASSALGVGRSTLDVDIVVDIREEHVEPLVERLTPAYYVDAESIREAIRRRRSFNVIHLDTMIKVDAFVAGVGPFDRASFERVTVHGIGGDRDRVFPLSTAEDVILRKLDWYERGDRVSERQWNDVLGVLRIQGAALDLEYLRRWAVSLGVDALLERAIEESTSDDA